MKNSILKKLLILVGMVVFSLSSFAQKSKLEIDFRDVLHKEAKDTTVFIKALDSPMWVDLAKSSCSCVKAKFSRKPVMAWDSVAIHINFSADDKGVFYKTLKVLCSDERLNHDIIIRGRVR